MEGHDYFFKKTFWGFSLPRNGSTDVYLREYPSGWVDALLDTCKLLDWEYEYLTKIYTPCIFIKTPDAIHHYFLSKRDAIIFRDEVMGKGEEEESTQECTHGFMSFM